MIVPERAAARQAAMKLKDAGGRPAGAGAGPASAAGTGAEVEVQAEVPKEGKQRGKKVSSYDSHRLTLFG